MGLLDENNINRNSTQNLIDHVRVSKSAKQMGEEYRESILQEVNNRINKSIRRYFLLKAGAIAASIILLIGISNTIAYHSGYKKINNHHIILEIPSGVRSSVELPDGTKVKLNAETTLSYPAAFTGRYREVTIDGEAFFEVVHNPKQPFIVKTNSIDVNVLGTSFNVKAYHEDPRIEVTLQEGEVRIGSEKNDDHVYLVAGEQLSYDKIESVFAKKKVIPSNYTSWTEGKLSFKGTPLQEIAATLQRTFNVPVRIENDSLKQITFTGDFISNENFEQILRVIIADERIKYKIENNTVILY